MIIIVAIILLVICAVVFVSCLFLKMVLKAEADRQDKVSKPLMCTDTADEGDTAREQFIANRTRLRSEGALFDDTLTAVQIINKDGLKLQGRYRLQNEPTHKWIISVHGFKDDHRFMLPYIKAFYEKGYNVFTQDNRAHGLSEGKYISMGWHDKDDVYEWMNYILEMDHEAQIVVHGISMGGATTMMLSGLNHPAVIGYIEDCGYTSTWDIFETVINRDYHLPAFPILHCCRLLSWFIMKYDYKKSSSLNQIVKCNKPIMFIHGENDGFVPAWMGHKCYESFTGRKELYIAPGAGHAESMDYYPDEYFEKVFRFIDSLQSE